MPVNIKVSRTHDRWALANGHARTESVGRALVAVRIVGDGPLLRKLHPTEELCKSRIGMKIVEI
jgi:hypothetical protein